MTGKEMTNPLARSRIHLALNTAYFFDRKEGVEDPIMETIKAALDHMLNPVVNGKTLGKWVCEYDLLNYKAMIAELTKEDTK